MLNNSHSHLRKQLLLKHLQSQIQKKINKDLDKRINLNPRPNSTEWDLGVYIEMLEPQVRHAVLELNKKGYSTDTSGFNDNTYEQKIEGDFQLDEKTTKKLHSKNVNVVTNPSGYTTLQFSPVNADINRIKRKWNDVAALLPDLHQSAAQSMTRRARDFRLGYI